MTDLKRGDIVYWDVPQRGVVVRGVVAGVGPAGVDVEALASMDADGNDLGINFDRYVTTMQPDQLRRSVAADAQEMSNDEVNAEIARSVGLAG